jgi:dipeptidyl aminopeptidase/acylaminoacyl peptidase
LEIQSPQTRVAPYGTWRSPITAELAAGAETKLTAPLLLDGVAWWLEGRTQERGGVALVHAAAGVRPVDAVSASFNVRTLAHEYGGGAYAVHDGVVICSRFDDQRLYRLDPGSDPVPITPDIEGRRHRYADGAVTADGSLWIGVRERHPEGGRSRDVVNELIAVPTDGLGEPRIVAEGRDFYSNPRIAPDGRLLAFLAWDLPWMPWDGCELFVGGLETDGTLSRAELVAGEVGSESIWQPEWSPGGDLVFTSDRSGWWNLERIRDGARDVVHAAEADFGYPAWVFGARSYGFLGDGRILAMFERGGLMRFAVVDPETGEREELDLPYDGLWNSPYLSVEGNSAVFIAGAATIPNQVVRLDLSTGSFDVLASAMDVPVDDVYLSVRQAAEFPTEGGLTAHALFYAPHNPDHAPPEGELPPLIVRSHGGPTSAATPVLDLKVQYWTSRGFAFVDVNYGGSTGYGRAYRQRLNGQWGVVDLQDCVNAARYLVAEGEADPGRLIVKGGSAGGYTTVCALTFTEEFAAGSSYYGLADVEQFALGDTHKFELEYEHTLVGPYPEAAELYRARSPIHFVDRIVTPMLVLQGTDDDVVPPAHAERIVEALRERGVPHAYLLFEGEGHGFRRAETIVTAMQAELSFYAQILGFEPSDPIPKLAIDHLA